MRAARRCPLRRVASCQCGWGRGWPGRGSAPVGNDGGFPGCAHPRDMRARAVSGHVTRALRTKGVRESGSNEKTPTASAWARKRPRAAGRRPTTAAGTPLGASRGGGVVGLVAGSQNRKARGGRQVRCGGHQSPPKAGRAEPVPPAGPAPTTETVLSPVVQTVDAARPATSPDGALRSTKRAAKPPPSQHRHGQLWSAQHSSFWFLPDAQHGGMMGRGAGGVWFAPGPFPQDWSSWGSCWPGLVIARTTGPPGAGPRRPPVAQTTKRPDHPAGAPDRLPGRGRRRVRKRYQAWVWSTGGATRRRALREENCCRSTAGW